MTEFASASNRHALAIPPPSDTSNTNGQSATRCELASPHDALILRLKTEIAAHHQQLDRQVKDTIELARIVGAQLHELKRLVGRGHWVPTLEELDRLYGIAPRTANLYMKVAAQWDQLQSRLESHELRAELSLRRAQQLLSKRPTSHGREGYLTPSFIIESVQRVFGGQIDCDPAAEPAKCHVPARVHLSADDDALQHVWHGRIFLHPPCDAPQMTQWIAHLEPQLGDSVSEAVALLPAWTDTGYFMRLAALEATFVFIRGRLTFHGTKRAAPFPSLLAYWGPDPRSFVTKCGPFGTVLRGVGMAVDTCAEGSDLTPDAQCVH